MKRKLIWLLSLALILTTNTRAENKTAFKPETAGKGSRLVLVTYFADNTQVRHVSSLIRSLRVNGGEYKNSDVFVVIGDTLIDFSALLKFDGVYIQPLRMNTDFSSFPLALKAFAAAQVEKTLSGNITLAWFDPETLILAPPSDLILEGHEKLVAQPAFQSNKIGLSPESQINEYWKPIFDRLSLDQRSIPVVTSLIGNEKMLAYYNCEIIAVKPDEGIFTEWADLLEDMLLDSNYVSVVCNSVARKLFLHQSVLSAVISKRIHPSDIKRLPLRSGYPLHSHTRLPKEIKAGSLNDISCVILEDLWNTNPGWIKEIEADEYLTNWLEEEYLRYMEIAPGLYRQEGSCNSYLVIAGDSSVIVDPAGAYKFTYWFEKILARKPLAAILLTHGHNDHRDHIPYWKEGKDIPVFAQEELKQFIEYQKMLAPFFARRNAIWTGQSPSSDPGPADNETGITEYFRDRRKIRCEGITFEMIHTSGETPDHTVIYVPEMKVVFTGDNYYISFPNLYTLRGTMPRWAPDYIASLDTALLLKPDLLLPGHDLWLKGPKEINFKAGGYRDAIKYVFDMTIKGINDGKDRYTLMKEVSLPGKYDFINQYYGNVPWSVRGICESYIGWFDENPSSMYAEKASDIYTDIIASSGIELFISLARKYLSEGNNIKALLATDIILKADPGQEDALVLRKTALKNLLIQSTNYIESIWLRYDLMKLN